MKWLGWKKDADLLQYWSDLPGYVLSNSDKMYGYRIKEGTQPGCDWRGGGEIKCTSIPTPLRSTSYLTYSKFTTVVRFRPWASRMSSLAPTPPIYFRGCRIRGQQARDVDGKRRVAVGADALTTQG